MGGLLESFPKSVRVRTKHAENTRVGFLGQSTILKAMWDVASFFATTNNMSTLR